MMTIDEMPPRRSWIAYCKYESEGPIVFCTTVIDYCTADSVGWAEPKNSELSQP